MNISKLVTDEERIYTTLLANKLRFEMEKTAPVVIVSTPIKLLLTQKSSETLYSGGETSNSLWFLGIKIRREEIT